MTRYLFALFQFKRKAKTCYRISFIPKIIALLRKIPSYSQIAVWVVLRVNITSALSFVHDLQVHCARLSQICIFSVFACKGSFANVQRWIKHSLVSTFVFLICSGV